jgi:hypothetical protein
LAKEHLEEYYKQDISDPKSQMTDSLAEWLNISLTEYKGKNSSDGIPGSGIGKNFHSGLPTQIIYEKIKSEYDNYGSRVKNDTFKTLGYDVKFAAHAIRIYHEGAELQEFGQLFFPIGGQAYNDIMRVRRGEVSLSEFRDLAQLYENVNRTLKPVSILPEQPDYKWANAYLVDILTQYIRNGGSELDREDGGEYI